MKSQISNKTVKALAAVVACVAFGTTAHAGNGYLGLGLGKATLDGAEDVVLSSTSTIEDSDTSFKVFGGYKFNKYFALDVAYVDFGTFSGSITVPGFGTVTDDWEATGLVFSGVVSIPVGEKFSFTGRLGFTAWQVEDTISFGSSSDTVDASGTDVNYGIGAAVDFTPKFGMSLEYEFFTGFGDENTNFEAGADVNLLSLSAYLKF